MWVYMFNNCVYYSLQFFQWLVMLQCSDQSYGSSVSQIIVTEAIVADMNIFQSDAHKTIFMFCSLWQWQFLNTSGTVLASIGNDTAKLKPCTSDYQCLSVWWLVNWHCCSHSNRTCSPLYSCALLLLHFLESVWDSNLLHCFQALVYSQSISQGRHSRISNSIGFKTVEEWMKYQDTQFTTPDL